MPKSYTAKFDILVQDPALLLETFDRYAKEHLLEVPDDEQDTMIEFALFWLITTDISPHDAGFEILESEVIEDKPGPARRVSHG